MHYYSKHNLLADIYASDNCALQPSHHDIQGLCFDLEACRRALNVLAGNYGHDSVTGLRTHRMHRSNPSAVDCHILGFPTDSAFPLVYRKATYGRCLTVTNACYVHLVKEEQLFLEDIVVVVDPCSISLATDASYVKKSSSWTE